MKIDTTQIPNFDALPDDAKAAISAMEFADAPDMSLFVEKSVFDRKAAEAGELSRKLKDKMSEDEAAAAERDAEWAEMKAKLEQLEREKKLSSYKASYLALGYDDELAEDTAKAMADGNMAKVFENQKKAAQAAEQRLKADMMRSTPRPEGAGPCGDKTEPAGVSIAKKLGKRKHESQSASDAIMQHYTR